jgi:hypothetical protein
MDPSWKEKSSSLSFQEFKDKWEPKFYKRESILEEVEQAEMSQSDGEGYKGINITKPLNNKAKEVENAECVQKKMKTSAQQLITLEIVPDDIADADLPDERPSFQPRSSSREPKLSEGKDKNDKSEESRNPSLEDSVQLVVVVEPTFPSAPPSRHGKRSSKEGGKSLRMKSMT